MSLTAALSAQDLRGTVTDTDDGQPVANASIVLSGTGKVTATDANGQFVLRSATCPTARCTLSISLDGYTPSTYEFPSNSLSLDPISVSLARIATQAEEEKIKPADLPTVTLEEAESETEGAGEVANVLNASRDVFQQISGYGWNPFRFRERGYDGGLFQTYVNGMPFNDLETGFTSFGELGGLNDVVRLRTSTVGLDPAEFAYGDIGGSTFIDTRASSQRKQIRASYASSNRTYRNRVMLTASTGLMPGGWAVTLSGSHRWAQEGYVPGTFMDAWAYFVGVDKKFGTKHAISLTAFGAPTKRGRAADSFEEMYQLAGSHYYNPNWGYWNGEKRNPAVNYNHQPTAIVRYDWTPSTRTSLLAAVYAQAGYNDRAFGNFINGRNPSPDFNRRLPTSFDDPVQSAQMADLLRRDEGFRQVNWESIWLSNYNSNATILGADGQAEQTKTGRSAIYINENRRSYNTERGANVFLNHSFNSRVSINGGGQYQWYKSHNYKELQDLFGADFWVDWDFLGNFDGATNPLKRNADIRTTNNIIYEGETFGYDYDENIRKASGWAQVQFALPKFQIFAAAEGGSTEMWREGYMQNGRFPNHSLGQSEKVSFTTYAAKGGLTYKANGRNYFYVHGSYGTRAPLFSNTFMAPRTRDFVVPNIEVSTVQSVEGGYLLRSPNYRARVTGYFTEFKNETENTFASAWSVGRVLSELDLGGLGLGDDENSLEQPVFFGAAVLQGIDRRHVGLEAALEAKPLTSWVFTAAASLGKFVYTNRPTLLISLDNLNEEVAPINGGEVFQKNFYVPRTPQTAATVGVKYEGKKFWFAGLSLNYVANSWYDFDRVRRTTRFLSSITPNEPIWNRIVDQQKADAGYTLDFFGGKSWRIQRGGKSYFINLNLGVNNLLDNQDIVISGRDAYLNAYRKNLRDPRFYSNEILYAFGLNYFASVTLRM